MTILCATPYDISAQWFYFDTMEVYNEKSSKWVNQYGDKVEEFEIQFIDGTSQQCELFNAVGVNQANLQEWFDTYSDMDDEEAFKLIYLINWGGYSDVNTAIDLIDDLTLTQQTLEEWAEDFADSTGMLSNVPDDLQYYFDFAAWGRDQECNGVVSQVYIDGRSYIAEGV